MSSFGATNFNIVGMQQITSTNAAQALTVPTAARHCMITVSTNSVRLGSATTVPVASTSGVVVAAGSPINFTDPAGDYQGVMTQLRFCAGTAGAQGVLDIMYFN